MFTMNNSKVKEEISWGITGYFEWNENEHTTYQNFIKCS